MTLKNSHYLPEDMMYNNGVKKCRAEHKNIKHPRNSPNMLKCIFFHLFGKSVNHFSKESYYTYRN